MAYGEHKIFFFCVAKKLLKNSVKSAGRDKI